MPHLLKFVQTPGLLIALNEWNAGYRQVFTDGRPLPFTIKERLIVEAELIDEIASKTSARSDT
jgi:hypothetical protein